MLHTGCLYLTPLSNDSTTDNELIAEFMGGAFYDSADLDHPNKWWFREQPHEGYRKDATHLASGLRYDRDWSWLMPVVEKMSEFGVWTLRPGFAYFENYAGEMRESHKFRFSKSTMDFETEDDSPVAWVFIVACVCLDGIKWHNRQKEK